MARAFDKLLREAVSHFTRFGFTSPADVNDWLTKLSAAASNHLEVEKAIERVEKALAGRFNRELGRGRLQGRKGKVSKLSIDQLEPRLRQELERRMYAARMQVTGQHRAALEHIHNRFLGMATAGKQPGKVKAAARHISKAARDAKAQARMTAIDQTFKLMATLDEVIAEDSQSIGGFWDATWDIKRKHRPEHAIRHDQWYPRRGCWADRDGHLKRALGYMDEWDMPGVLINCQCQYRYVYDLEDVPPQFLTAKGRKAA